MASKDEVQVGVAELAGPEASEASGEAQLTYVKLPAWQYRAVFAGLSLAILAVGLDGTVVVTTLPSVAAQFEASEQVSWIVIAYLLGSCIVSPLVGRLSEIVGRRMVLVAGVVVFTLFSVLCGLSDLAPSIWWLVAARFFQGVGGGALVSSALVVISDLTPARTRGKALAPIALIFAVSQIAGPVVGGLLTDMDVPGLPLHSWTLCYLINVPIGLVTGLLFARFVPADMGRRAAGGAESLDKAGAAACTVAVSSLALVLTTGGATYEWGSPVILALLGVGLAFGTLFVAVEVWVAEHPIVPFRTFRERNVATAAWTMVLASVGQMAVSVFLPVWLQTVKGQSALQSGVTLIPLLLGLPVAAIVTGLSVSKTGKYWLQPVLAALAMIAGGAWLANLAPDTTAAVLGLQLFLLGLSFGVAPVTCTPQAQAAVSDDYRAVMASSLSFLNVIGLLLGAAVAQTIVNNNTKALTQSSTLDDASRAITDAFYVTAAAGGLFLLGALASQHIPLSDGTAEHALLA